MDGDNQSTNNDSFKSDFKYSKTDTEQNQRDIVTDLKKTQISIHELNLGDNSDVLKDYNRFFGHTFNEKWQLVDKSGELFKFDVHNDPSKNNQRYNQIGERITDYIYELLSSKCNLQKLYIPVGSQGPAFIFVSKDISNEINTEVYEKNKESLQDKNIVDEIEDKMVLVEEECDDVKNSKDEKIKDGKNGEGIKEEEKVMLLIHGSGVVRAGQWSRRIIMNNDLMSGSQLPFITTALSQGYRVVVYNGNHVTDLHGNPIKDLDTAIKHGRYVWQEVIERLNGKVFVVAHSYGGSVALNMAIENRRSFMKKVAAVAFTDSYTLDTFVEKEDAGKSCDDNDSRSDDDSWKSIKDIDDKNGEKKEEKIDGVDKKDTCDDGKKENCGIDGDGKQADNDDDGNLIQFFKKRSREWIASDLKLDEKVPSPHHFERFSAGHSKHEWTTTISMPSIFSFFKQHWTTQHLHDTNNPQTILTNNKKHNLKDGKNGCFDGRRYFSSCVVSAIDMASVKGISTSSSNGYRDVYYGMKNEISKNENIQRSHAYHISIFKSFQTFNSIFFSEKVKWLVMASRMVKKLIK